MRWKSANCSGHQERLKDVQATSINAFNSNEVPDILYNINEPSSERQCLAVFTTFSRIFHMNLPCKMKLYLACQRKSKDVALVRLQFIMYLVVNFTSQMEFFSTTKSTESDDIMKVMV